jgi:hypothetical protein
MLLQDDIYKEKYLKYKNKYITLKNQYGSGKSDNYFLILDEGQFNELRENKKKHIVDYINPDNTKKALDGSYLKFDNLYSDKTFHNKTYYINKKQLGIIKPLYSSVRKGVRNISICEKKLPQIVNNYVLNNSSKNKYEIYSEILKKINKIKLIYQTNIDEKAVFTVGPEEEKSSSICDNSVNKIYYILDLGEVEIWKVTNELRITGIFLFKYENNKFIKKESIIDREPIRIFLKSVNSQPDTTSQLQKNRRQVRYDQIKKKGEERKRKSEKIQKKNQGKIQKENQKEHEKIEAIQQHLQLKKNESLQTPSAAASDPKQQERVRILVNTMRHGAASTSGVFKPVKGYL